MEKIKVGVFPAGTEIGLEICNALSKQKNIELIGLVSEHDHAEAVYKKTAMIPFFHESDFVDRLNELISREKIEFIYPAHDDVLLFLTRRMNEIHAEIVTSPLATIEITRSKRATYRYLEDEKITPYIYDGVEEIKEFPVFIKPDIGQGSKGAKKIESREQLEWELQKKEDLIICEYLPGDESTVDCFTGLDGKISSVIIRSRERIRNGIAVKSRIVKCDDEIRSIAETLNKKFIFNGAWFFQLKKDINDNYKLLEIAARIPGTAGLSRNLGINYEMLTLYNCMKMRTQVSLNSYDISVDRALISRYKTNINYKYVYVDWDDTIIIDDKVNTELIRFLYQCSNDGKCIYLLTKHNGNMEEELEHYKICIGLFDEIIHLKEGEFKSSVIKEKEAIFIDDSFAERQDVCRNNNIPVFGVENVEALLNWWL